MSDTKEIIEYVRGCINGVQKVTFGKDTVKSLLNALEQAEARAEKAEEELADVYVELDEMADELTDYRGIESDLADAEREIEELRDELEDSRGTEKDAPDVLCAIARLVGAYEHSQEIGDDMGEMTLDAARDLLADKQTAEAKVARLTKERDWLATQLTCIQSAYDIDQKTRDWSTARWSEAASRAVTAGEE